MHNSASNVFVSFVLVCFIAHVLWAYFEEHGVSTTIEDIDREKNSSVCHHHHLDMDTARVTFVSKVQLEKLDVLSQSTNCWECPMEYRANISAQNATDNFNTNFRQKFQINGSSGGAAVQLCSLEALLQDQNHYIFTITESANGSSKFDCTLVAQCSGIPDNNIPVYVLLALCVFLFFVWQFLMYLFRRGCFNCILFWYPQEQLINNDLGMPLIVDDSAPSMMDATTSSRENARIKSVDTFRGLSLMVMIFVNYGGGNYWYFNHSIWDGLTAADLVFAWFVFLMGTSIAMSFRGALRRGTSRLTLFGRVVRRSAILFFLGLCLSNKNRDLSELRILGVLQRLALTYFIVASLETFSATPADEHLRKWWSFMRDLVPFWKTWLVTGCLVALHLFLTFLLPVPDCPRGYLGPGGLHEDRVHENCTGGAAGYIDRVILGASHLYQHPTCKETYKTTVPYDPEGILGILTSVLLCVLGLQAGKILQTYQYWVRRVKRWIGWAFFTGLMAGMLCEFRQFGGFIPVNKNLWSLSYVLALASMAFVLLSIFYIIVDVYEFWSGAPFIYPGMNSIVIYVCSEVFEEYFPLQFKVPSNHVSLLSMNVWGVVFWIIISGLLYRRKVFIAI